LLVVAHPDDEYTCAATIYRLSRELGTVVDQVVLTNGEGGFKYSQLAERIYGAALTREDVGRSRLPAIRKQETLAAGKILGIRNHYFLDYKDARFTLDSREALDRLWNTKGIAAFLDGLLRKERYSFVFVMLPTSETHGHHQAASLLALEAVGRLPKESRPVVLGALPAKHGQADSDFEGSGVIRLLAEAPVYTFDRTASFGPDRALSYQIVVNWAIAEHKSQGLFQTESNHHEEERFYLFAESGPTALRDTERLFRQLSGSRLAVR
jgi:LmbE family N-acetylglucosaminyl deacetylase